MFKKLINRFRAETWETLSEERVTVGVYRHGFHIDTINSILKIERSSRGNTKHWITETRGVKAGQPYEVNPVTKKPI